MMRDLFRQPAIIYAIWAVLLFESALGAMAGRLSVAAVGLVTLALTMIPVYSHRLFGVHIPPGFAAAIAAFLCATLFLGEIFGFYHRYWWWDVVLHTGSAIGFGLTGVILMLMLVNADKISAAPVTVSLFAFCFAVTVGAVWEIFEYGMDQAFGTNMQRSGLRDTMGDLIVDCLGAAIGASAGYLYLKGIRGGPLSGIIHDFVRGNRRMFRVRGPASVQQPAPARAPAAARTKRRKQR